MSAETERNNPHIPEYSSKKESSELSLIWQKAVEAAQELAKVKQTKVTRIAPSFKLELGEEGIFHFRVNCAIANPEEKLEVMVVDVGYQEEESSDEIIPAQQVVIKSTWTGNEITDTVSDPSNIQDTRWKLDEALMGRYVAGMLKHLAGIERQKKSGRKRSKALDKTPVVVNVPKTYSTGIN